MFHHVLKIPHSLVPCKGTSSLSYISFDEFIKLSFSFINVKGKIPSEFHEQYLKLYDDTKENCWTKKWAGYDVMLCVSESQSNAVSSIPSSKSHIK